MYIISHVAPSACNTDTKECALNQKKAKSDKEKRSSKHPGMDFVCPPVLVDMLGHHWRDVQDGFSDPAALNTILVFQSDELRWTAQKRGECELNLGETSSRFMIINDNKFTIKHKLIELEKKV